MTQLLPSCSLSKLNTLNLSCVASKFIALDSEEDLINAFENYPLNVSNIFVLGGGSNVILPEVLDQFVLSFRTKSPNNGVVIKEESQDTVLLEVDAGVEWDSFVHYCVQQSYSGLENLSLIPGTVGAAPIQNIGAYGVEVADTLEQVKVFNVVTKQLEYFSTDQCQFAYRDSLFKQNPGQFVIVSVSFRLSKKPVYILDYGELSALKNSTDLNSELIRKTVIETRQAKLPDPKVLPNAGSFFKNPIVSALQAAELKKNFPNIVSYPLASSDFKLAAAWLIDQAGWKGFRNDRVGIHDKQALVVVNHNHGTQSDIVSLAKSVQNSVFDMFNVNLEIEPILL